MRYVIARKKVFKTNNVINRLLKKEKLEKLHKFSSCLKFKRDCEKSRKKFRTFN